MALTSKEALDWLINYGYKLSKSTIKEAENIVLKDLEELESIKSCLADYNLDITQLRKICMFYLMNKDYLKKLESEIQIRIDTLQKRQEYLNSCTGDMECYIEFNFNRKKLELLFELKEVFKNGNYN